MLSRSLTTLDLRARPLFSLKPFFNSARKAMHRRSAKVRYLLFSAAASWSLRNDTRSVYVTTIWIDPSWAVTRCALKEPGVVVPIGKLPGGVEAFPHVV